MFFPKEFTLDQPWGGGSFPHDIAQHSISKNLTALMELSPQAIAPPKIVMPIKNLVHSTHYETAQKILTEGLQFKGSKKFRFYGSYVCIDKENKTYVQMGEEWMPGYFLWWSLENSNIKLPELTEPVITKLPNDDGIIETKWSGVSPQFSDVSIFGSVKFTLDFQTAIASYLDSYASIISNKEPKILYKLAGTLRYPQQPGYIIIICVEEGGIDPFPGMESIMFDRLIIEQPYKVLEYKIQKDSSGVTVEGAIDISWDIYSLAFHFPDHHPSKSFTVKPLETRDGSQQSKVAISHLSHSICIRPDCKEMGNKSLLELKKCYENYKTKGGPKVEIEIVH